MSENLVDPLANSNQIVPSEMMVRIATKLRSLSFPNPDPDLHQLHFWYPAARTAIEALREPTRAMCGDGADAADELSTTGAKAVWQAMVDRALSDLCNAQYCVACDRDVEKSCGHPKCRMAGVFRI